MNKVTVDVTAEVNGTEGSIQVRRDNDDPNVITISAGGMEIKVVAKDLHDAMETLDCNCHPATPPTDSNFVRDFIEKVADKAEEFKKNLPAFPDYRLDSDHDCGC